MPSAMQIAAAFLVTGLACLAIGAVARGAKLAMGCSVVGLTFVVGIAVLFMLRLI